MDQILPCHIDKLHVYIVTFQFKNIFKRYFTKVHMIFRVSVYVSTQYKACSYHFPLDILKKLICFYYVTLPYLYKVAVHNRILQYHVYKWFSTKHIVICFLHYVIPQTLVSGRECIIQRCFLLYVVHIDETAFCVSSSCDENP